MARRLFFLGRRLVVRLSRVALAIPILEYSRLHQPKMLSERVPNQRGTILLSTPRSTIGRLQ